MVITGGPRTPSTTAAQPAVDPDGHYARTVKGHIARRGI
jgi:hypothetical protein